MRHDVVVRTARMILIAETLKRRPDLDHLASLLECSTRTARRYLEALEYAGWVWPQEREQ